MESESSTNYGTETKVSTSQNNTMATKVSAQQHADKNGQESDIKSHPTPIIPQRRDDLSEAATRTRQTSSKHNILVLPLYMATKSNGAAMYPVINNVQTLQVPERRITYPEEISTDYSEPHEQSTQTSQVKPTHQDPTSSKQTQVIPQRPQDLLDNISLDMARQNVKSSAQYRKSYAFKIWRDRGSFPYRLAEQPTGVVKDVVPRKKSKKTLNALRAQKDREKEKAWKAFKSCRTTSNDLKYQRTPRLPRNRVEATSIDHHVKDQLNTIFSDYQDNDPISTNAKHQNSIPDYFKNKKESAQSKPLVSPTKSIPTSVIHVHTAKACLVPKHTTQAEQTIGMTYKDVSKGFKPQTQTQTAIQLTTTDPPSEEDVGDQRSDTHTSSVGKYNMHTDNQEQFNANAVSGRQKISVETMTESAEDSSDSSERNSSSGVQTNKKDRCNDLHISENLPITSNGFEKNPGNRVKDIELSPTKHTGNFISEQSPSPNLTEQPSGNSEIDNSNLAIIIKDSLAKKYSKENLKPIPGSTIVTQARKRAKNDPTQTERGEHHRARIKQQKTTMFTRLDESVATNLADGIHNVNSEYFPIEALAKKAAKESSKGVTDHFQSKLPPNSIKHKLDEIERARLLLKELFDVTSESGGDNEMKTFDVASRSFGRKNILNHLSLIDRYFAEFQKKLSNSERPDSLA